MLAQVSDDSAVILVYVAIYLVEAFIIAVLAVRKKRNEYVEVAFRAAPRLRRESCLEEHGRQKWASG